MKKRLLAMVLATVMVMGAGACGANDQDSTDNGADASETERQSGQAEAPGETEEAEAPKESGSSGYQTTYGSKQFDNVKIQVELFDRSNAPEGNTITDNRWVDYAKEAMDKVGIELEFVAVPRSDEVEKMQTMMSSDTAPTITFTYTYSYARDYYESEGIWDLSEFVDGDDQAVNLKNYIGDECMDIGRMPGGELYGVVARRATVASPNLFIRTDWLEELGLDIPTNVEELTEAIRLMAKENPDGRSDIIGIWPLGLENGATIYPYVGTIALAFMKNVNDERQCAIQSGFEYYADEGYRDYIHWLNQMYNEGLINQEYFAQTGEQSQSYIVNGQIACFEQNVGYNVDILRGSLLQALQANDSSAEMESISPMYSSVYPDSQYTDVYGAGGMILFCPKTATAEEVEAAITYLDWMATEEGGFAIYHGFEGEHFEYNEDGVPMAKDGEFNAVDKDWIRTDMFLVGNQGYFQTVEDFNISIAADNPGYEKYVMDDYTKSLEGKHYGGYQYMNAPESQMEIQTDLDLLRSEYMVKCITCESGSFDSLYDEFITKLEAAGIKQVMEDRAAIYDEVRGK